MRKSDRFRVCAVCGKRHGPTYGFQSVLRHSGLTGDKATIECIRKLALPPETVRRMLNALEESRRNR